VSTKRNGTSRKKGSVENISCAAESMERDFFSLFGSMLGFEEPNEMNGDSIDEDEANDEEEVPATRIYADMRKQRLRNQFLTFERDNLKQQLKERLEEIQQLKERIQEQTVETKKFQEQALQQSEKVADMVNDLLDI
jgi:flagellar motility protein MotE (MotC chaperone)